MASTSTPTPTPSTSTSNSIPSASTEDLVFDEAEIERILNSEATLVSREAEVARVLKAFRMNPYDVLQLDFMPSANLTESDIRKSPSSLRFGVHTDRVDGMLCAEKTYRKKSLLIHPDKLKHEQAIEAFDLLKKAQTELVDPKRREALDNIILDARMLVLRAEGMAPITPDTSPRVTSLTNPDFRERIRLKTKELLIDQELRRRRVNKMTMIAEGAQAKKDEEALEKRKRKMEDDKRWEETREDRVTDWRSFQKGGKKKKTKTNVLGS
ncbi:BZ3500_MvSof-1268-A1-R1_Chr11-1g03201 [Microbotryum saponariae]|uniref:BZ3500_MvSof-1268-A1-R1_Chr11-1g03201 protein n=1 Tax=Microbotryum saponariae TaxID=289078 RepID=A0A2X0LA57_9BASI|nr:BZ3501_MvSof-1269-A2-R1_Chr11g02776 [Microbotryum saponariae]SDA03761.1 BZ3500_MvSof-1268-A1-R1_Chr11-1g03201 [Microbotryum saponariae]